MEEQEHQREASVTSDAPGSKQSPKSGGGLTVSKKKTELKKALSNHMMGFAKNFWRYDTDGSGEIDPDEFQAALHGLRLPYAEDIEVTKKLFEDMDFDGSGTLSQNEVVRYALLDIMGKSRDRIRNLCKLWDYDNSNTINRDEFGRVIEALGIEVPVAVIDEIFKDLDEERTGELIYEEFTRKLRGQSGGAARQLAEAEPKPTESEIMRAASLKLVAANVAARLRRRQSLQEAPPPAVAPPKIYKSSSLPPSDDEGSDQEDMLTPRRTAAEGKQLLHSFSNSTLLQDATSAMTKLALERHAAARERAAQMRRIQTVRGIRNPY